MLRTGPDRDHVARALSSQSKLFTPALLQIWLISLTTFLSVQLLSASLPLYAVRLGADDALLGIMAGVIAVVSLGARPLVGWWLELGGGAWALGAGALLFAVCSAGYWIAASVGGLIAFRALTGVAVALTATAGQALAADLAPEQRRGEALSLFSISITLAQMAGPPAGVAVTHLAGFPALFALSIAVGLASVAMTWPLRRFQTTPVGPPRRRLLNPRVLGPGVLMVALMVGFGANAALLAVHASRRDLENPGFVLTGQAVGLLVSQLVVGRLSDRFGRVAVIVPGLLLAAVSMWAIALLGGWWLVLAGALSGGGLGAGQPPLYALAVDLVPPDERGSALASMGVFLEIGIVFGAIGGGFIGRAIGLTWMYALAGLAPALGATFALTRRRERTPT